MTNLDTAVITAVQAGQEIMKIYDRNFSVEYKDDKSPLTEADRISNAIICENLKDTYPIISEENKLIEYAERKDWKTCWLIDPIDGTKEFIKKNGEFTVNIALVEDQIPVLGVIYVPALKELYFASKEKGSFKVSEISDFTSFGELSAGAAKLPIAIKKECYTVVASKSHLSPETEAYILELEKEHGKISSTSKGSSLKLCMVAEGQADCYPRFAPTMEWDTAAGQAICMYAGKEVLDYKTQAPMLYNRKNLLNNWFLVR